MLIADLIFLIVLAVALVVVYKVRKLTLAGTIAGGLVAILIFMGAALPGILMLAAFFVLATMATSWKKEVKGKEHEERRTALQVLANGGMAALVALAMWTKQAPGYHLILLAAALSAATADTLSSELGMIYGTKFYNILNFKPGIRGDDGVISLEGTVMGLGGSSIIALIYILSFGINGFWTIVIAGTAGNLFDSLLGATLERKGYIQNNMVNFLNTLFAVLVARAILII